MKIRNTKLSQSHALVELGEGVFLKALPMAELQQYFKSIEKDMEKNPEDTVNGMFDKMIVDADGNKFEDLVDAKAMDVLPVETITFIMEAIPKAMTPDPKR